MAEFQAGIFGQEFPKLAIVKPEQVKIDCFEPNIFNQETQHKMIESSRRTQWSGNNSINH